MNWNNLAVFAGMLILWFGLVRYVLPALGVPTCMTGACRVAPGQSCPLESAAESEAGLDEDRSKIFSDDAGEQAEGKSVD